MASVFVFEDFTSKTEKERKSNKYEESQRVIFEDLTNSNEQTAESEAVPVASRIEVRTSVQENLRWQDQSDRQKDTVKNQKKRQKELSTQSITSALVTSCCPKRCLNKFYLSQMLDRKKLFLDMCPGQQRHFIRDSIRKGEGENGLNFFVEGKEVCEEAWKVLYGVKDTRYRQIKKVIQTGASKSDLKSRRPLSRKLLMAKSWLSSYAANLAEKQPDKEELHLPSCLTKLCIFEKYKEEMGAANEDTIEISRFREMWMEHFPHLKINKGKGGLHKCTDCTNFQELMMTKLSKVEKTQVLAMRTDHLNLQTTCRQKYYKHIKKAKQNPEKYCSIIIDNMDQAKTNLPRFRIPTKADAHLTKMHHHVTGLKCHGEDLTQVYTWTDVFHPDSNITLNCLVNVLDYVYKTHEHTMPEVLYLQADNSGKDNKNNFVLAFLASLVKRKVFRKIKLSFLMVGHTHEDVDQVFSRISQRLHVEEAHTLPDLHRVVGHSYTPRPEVLHLASLWDLKSAFTDMDKLKGISQPHIFKFVMKNDRVTMSYKDWPVAHEKYREVDVTDICTSFSRRPVPVLPNPKIHPIVNKMTSDLEKWGHCGRLSENEVHWWETYIPSIVPSSRVRPGVPLPSQLGTYRMENPAPTSSNLTEAVKRANRREKNVSEVKPIKKRRA